MIHFVVGDATLPRGGGTKVICHCVNDAGGWGSGFVVALSRRWKTPERSYREWHKKGRSPTYLPLVVNTIPDSSVPFELGQVQFVQVEPEIWVANIIGQHKTISLGEKVPVRYEALAKGFEAVQNFCLSRQATAHMPRIGADRARGDWATIENLIKKHLEGSTVYTLPQS